MLKLFAAVMILVSLNWVHPDTNCKAGPVDGTWVPVEQWMNGKPLPKSIYEKQKLILSDSSYTVFAESVDKGIVQYQDNHMDIYGKEGVNAGRHFPALYKLDNGRLTICYNLMGNEYPKDFETNSKGYFLSVFEKTE